MIYSSRRFLIKGLKSLIGGYVNPSYLGDAC